MNGENFQGIICIFVDANFYSNQLFVNILHVLNERSSN